MQPLSTTNGSASIYNNESVEIMTIPLSLQPQPPQPSHYDIRKPEPGTGFDNFLPKQQAAKPTSTERNNDDGGNNGSDGNDDNNGDGPKKGKKKNKKVEDAENITATMLTSMALLLYIVLDYMQRRRSDDPQQQQQQSSDGMPESRQYDDDMSYGTNSSMSRQQQGRTGMLQPQRDITWHDFLRLLQQRDVQKVVIMGNGSTAGGNRGGGSSSNSGNGNGNNKNDGNTTAYVYLTPNATGLTMSSAQSYSSMRPNIRRMNDDSSSTSRESSPTQQQQQPLDGFEHWSSSSGNTASNNNTDSFGFSNASSNSSLLQQSNTPSYRLQIGSIDSFERKLDEAQRALGRSELDDVPIQFTDDTSNAVVREIYGILPSLFATAVTFFIARFAISMMLRGSGGGSGGPGNMFSIGKSTAKKIKKEDISITFADVAGCDEAKKEIMEFVDFLKDSERFTKLGAKIPKGALLCGPPGTGKTLLAKAVAGEAGVPFYSISGSDFIEMFVGVGPSRVRDLFSEARENAPCIIFIDEIDAVGRQRGRGNMGGNDERENTLNQLLVEMDGFSPSTGVVVLAGTNRVDVLDQALTRPGRFDRQITVDKPDLQGRKEIFKVHLKGITLENSIEDVAGRLAGLTPGFAGADIANICNEAAIVAARRKGETVSFNDFEKATDRIIGGLESNKIMSKEERSIVAHHEAGHAVAGWFLEHADALLKVTIIPRSSGALGFAQYLPKEVFLRTQKQIMDIVCMALAGRAAEEIFFGSVTTGASDDLRRVTQLVYSTIQLYGMNSRLGQLSFPKDPNAMFEDRPYSEKTAKVMDEEARAIVDTAYERTLTLLRSKKDEVAMVAKLLLDRETITHDDMITLIGERPFKGDAAYDEYIRRRPPASTTAGAATDDDADVIAVPEEDDTTTTITPNLAFKG
jgi:AFG3 family protein